MAVNQPKGKHVVINRKTVGKPDNKSASIATPRCTRRTSGKINTPPTTVVSIHNRPIQYKASPVKYSRNGKMLYIPSPVKFPALARNKKPPIHVDAGNSLPGKEYLKCVINRMRLLNVYDLAKIIFLKTQRMSVQLVKMNTQMSSL